MTTQEETITWHSADEKPNHTSWKYYLCHYREYEYSISCVGELRWNGYRWKLDIVDDEFDVWEVITWAELPKGWQE